MAYKEICGDDEEHGNVGGAIEEVGGDDGVAWYVVESLGEEQERFAETDGAWCERHKQRQVSGAAVNNRLLQVDGGVGAVQLQVKNNSND